MKQESTPQGKVRLGIRGERVDVGAHIAYLWESEEEFREGILFLVAGLRIGDGCVIFGHAQANVKVLELLREEGVDTDQEQAEGKLSVLGGAPRGDTMLAEIGATFQKMIDGGAKLIRLLGNIGWGKEGWPVETDILQFEAKVTGAAKSFPCIVVCMYDVHSLSGRIIVDGALATHPITFCGNVMRHNPYHIPLDDFLKKKLKQPKVQ